jgi:hypothetical protein
MMETVEWKRNSRDGLQMAARGWQPAAHLLMLIQFLSVFTGQKPMNMAKSLIWMKKGWSKDE